MNMEPIIPLMELCGTKETVGTPTGPEALPVSQSRQPPSPFQLAISPIEVLHTPRSKSEAFVTATPSPALLNPLAQDYWSESSARCPILCPRLESSQARIIRRLQVGFTVVSLLEPHLATIRRRARLFSSFSHCFLLQKLHDGSCTSLVKIRLAEDSSCLHVSTATTAETENDKKSQEDELLHSIAIADIERVESGKESLNQQLFEITHHLKCFSIVSKTTTDLTFVCDSAQQRATIVSSLITITNKGTLRMRPASLEVSREPIGVRMNLGGDFLHAQPASLSPMQRTRIYAESMAEGQELSLNYSDDEDALDIPGTLHRRSSSTNAFSFADVASQQSSEEDNMVVEHTDTMLAISFHEALDEWCSDDACTLDLTDVSASLGGIFHILGGSSAATQHVRVNSTDAQLQNSCMADFLNTPASIWADLPSTSKDKKEHNSTDGGNKRIRNRASITNAQALRWRQLRTEMTFESIVQSAQYRMASIATAKSLDDFDRPNRRASTSTECTSHGIFDLLSAKLRVVGSDVATDDKDCDFYDSDPGDAKLLMRRRGPRRVLAERLNKIEADKMRSSKKLDFSLRHANVKGKQFDEEQTNAIIEVSHDARESMFEAFYK